MMGSGVPSSGQQQYSHEHMYHQQDITTPYIPPYRPAELTGNDQNPVQKEQDQSSGRQHINQ